jgi:hypothetical protein
MIYDKIGLYLPTYKRVKNNKLPTFIKSAIETSYCINNICFTFGVNSDDIETLDYLQNLPCQNLIDLVIYPSDMPPHFAKMLNKIYLETCFNEKSTIVTMLGDDMEFLTPNWDKLILDKFNESTKDLILYCDDDYLHHEKLSVNLFTTRQLVNKTLKPFMCERYSCDWCDTIWYEFGKRNNLLCYMNDIKIRHNHASKSKDLIDETIYRLRKNYIDINKNQEELNYFWRYVKEMENNANKIHP